MSWLPAPQLSVPAAAARLLPRLCIALLLGAGACQGPHRAPVRLTDSAPTDSLGGTSRSPLMPLRIPPTVDVLVSRGQRAEPLEIGGSTAGRVTLERSDEGVRTTSGIDLGREVWLGPEPRGAGLELGERLYAGRLLVRPARRGPGLEVLNRVALEEYVAGVLSAELSMWSAQPSELEAQAIACRTFAVHELATPRPYLFADVSDQVYRGKPPVESAAPVGRAVSHTRGQVLVEAGRIVDARYHAACGGDTARGEVVFPSLDFCCLASVECAPCRAHEGPADMALGSAGTWRTTLTAADLELLALELEIGDHVTSFEPATMDTAGRWLSVRFEGPRGSGLMSFEDLRGQLGTTRIKSARVVRTWPRARAPISRDGGLFLEGRGRGHGVGLCQTGARGYAHRGWSAERILAHYYPGARIARGTRSDS